MGLMVTALVAALGSTFVPGPRVSVKTRSFRASGLAPTASQAPAARERSPSAVGAAAMVAAAAVAAGGVTRRRRMKGSPLKRAGRATSMPRRFFGGGGDEAQPQGGTIYDYTVKNIDGGDVPLKTYEGKVALIVNVASKWGLTASNYAELCDLTKQYNSRGLEVLLFPCNQFGGQEPGSNGEVKAFAEGKCPGGAFQLFDKVDVNGDSQAPLFAFLKSQQGGGLFGDDIVWNFNKFLVDRQGKVTGRFGPQESPKSFEDKITALL